MNAAETSASSAIADWTPLTVVPRSFTTAAIETFINDVSTTSTNIAAARRIASRGLAAGSSRTGVVAPSDIGSIMPDRTGPRRTVLPAPRRSPSRVRVDRSHCVVRASGGPVYLDRHPAGADHRRSDQLERRVRAGVGEQPRALADDHGEGEQVDLVDEVVVEEPPELCAAAVHLQLASRRRLQRADGSRDVTGEDGRVRPLGVGEWRRC